MVKAHIQVAVESPNGKMPAAKPMSCTPAHLDQSEWPTRRARRKPRAARENGVTAGAAGDEEIMAQEIGPRATFQSADQLHARAALRREDSLLPGRVRESSGAVAARVSVILRVLK